MKIAIAVLAGLLIVIALCGLAESCGKCCSTTDQTWVSNWSHKPIRATTDYDSKGEHSDFVNRLICPGTYQADYYMSGTPVTVDLWVDGANGGGPHKTIHIETDRSIVGYDTTDGTGVDIFLANCFTLIQKDGEALTTIYPQ